MESIVKTLSINELCELRNVYQDRASERLPIVPQSYKENKSVQQKSRIYLTEVYMNFNGCDENSVTMLADTTLKEGEQNACYCR